MFSFFENDDEPHSRGCTVSNLRDVALIVFGRYLAAKQNLAPNDDFATEGAVFLSIQETENILREHSDYEEEGVFGVGGDTPDEANANMQKLIGELCSRILSNVLAAGVKQDLLDCQFDGDRDNFQFSLTEKGLQLAAKLENPDQEGDR